MSDREQRRVLSIQAAMEQNAEHFGFDLCDYIDIGDGVTLEIPYRELLNADQKKAVDAVYRDYELCDRVKIEAVDGDGKATHIEGQFKEPRVKDDVPFDLDERVSVALWGQENYDKYAAVGGPPGLVLMTWGRMRDQINRRLNGEPKSLRGV